MLVAGEFQNVSYIYSAHNLIVQNMRQGKPTLHGWLLRKVMINSIVMCTVSGIANICGLVTQLECEKLSSSWPQSVSIIAHHSAVCSVPASYTYQALDNV